MGADLLHQFALAAMPEIIRAHPGYAAKTVAVEAYSIASYMVEQGKRAEKEFGQEDLSTARYEAHRLRVLAIAQAVVIFIMAAIMIAILAMQPACAATSADVEREISGAFERSEVSTRERWALAAMIVADVAGNESTVSAIGRGCRESNPLYGSSPGRAQLYAVDAVVWAGYLWAANRPGWKVQWFGYVRAAISAGNAVSNYRTEC